MHSREIIFHPLSVLVSALGCATLYVIAASLRFSGEKLSFEYLYVAPIVVPFATFLFERAERFRQTSAAQWVVDALVVLTAMWRVIGHVPLISGHALFLTYSLLTARSRVAQITASVVMLQVIYLKLFVWHDFVTLAGGILLGLGAALLARHLPGSQGDAEASDAEVRS